MRGQAGLETIRVRKTDLIEKITENRAAHHDTFDRAVDAYRARALELLEQRVAEIRRGEPISLHFGLPTPEDYTHVYDEALAQLEWTLDDEIELDQQTFAQLVLNKWEWAQRFMANTASYLAE